jgi:hypothetical protein
LLRQEGRAIEGLFYQLAQNQIAAQIANPPLKGDVTGLSEELFKGQFGSSTPMRQKSC